MLNTIHRGAGTAGRSACPPMHATPASARLPCRPRTTALRATLPDLSEKPKAPDSAPAKAPAPRKQPDPAPRPPSNPGPDDKPSTVEVVLDKAADSALDIYRHVRRLVQAKPTSSAVDRLVRGAEGKFQLKRADGKPVVVVLGSGWAAHSCIKVIDTDRFDVFVVSPRNHFCFTPMLPSTAVGTVEFRSLLEPIRTSNEFVGYLEASCNGIDLENKVATCAAATMVEGTERTTFELPYDILVVAVGEQPATFGVPGVQEHCSFMKEISDTVTIRNKIGGCFETAALPGTTDEDRRRLLHFAVVGGGPTGVEFAGTLSDYVRSDLRRKYPHLMPYVKVSLLQSAQTILTQFDSKLATSALENLNRTGVTVRTGVRVVEVTKDEVVLKDGERLPYGLCVWSVGNAARPLVQDMVSQLPDQAQYQRGPANLAKLAVDRYQRVVGAKDVLALGDCSYVIGDSLPTTAQVAAQQGAYMAHVINRGYVIGRGGIDQPAPSRPLPKGPLGLPALPLPGSNPYDGASYAELAAAVSEPDASVARCRQTFEFVSLGIMAYVGDDKALTQIEAGENSLNLYGGFAFLLWRSVYITKQVSFRNRVLILFDWIKTRVFGRDLSMF